MSPGEALMLHLRILIGSLMIAALVGLVLLDAWLSADLPNHPGPDAISSPAGAPRWGLPTVAVAAALALLASLEFASLLRQKGYQPATAWAVLISVGLVVLPWLEQAFAVADPGAGGSARPATLVWLMAGILGTCLCVLIRRSTEGAITAMATTLLILAFVGGLGSFLVRIRCLAPGPGGALLVLYVVLVIKACDIGAYLFGRVLGRTPLAPWLSPGKTVEGFLAGLLLACAVAEGGSAAWEAWGVPRLGPPPFGPAQALVFGAIMAVMGHLGDLTESAFKRDLGVKDSGAAVVAFGGFLDILDSPLFAAPAAWWLLTTLGSRA